jgi:lactate dehydrogenase-like 2-hydroxyacid dehydrogenase
MADEAFFKAAKKGALIINTARGGVIDMDALYDAMKGGKVWAAGLDVLSKEPPDNDTKLIRAWRRDEPWLRHRLLITPHCAFYSQKAFDEMRRKAAQEVKRVLEGKKPLNCVNYINYVNYKTR